MKWCGNTLMRGPFLALVQTEAAFHKELKRMRLPATEWPRWLNANADATTHTLINSKGKLCIFVALGPCVGCSGIEIAGLLVHEAVHVFQRYCEHIGEDRPSTEFEAYSTQAIAQELMAAYQESIT